MNPIRKLLGFCIAVLMLSSCQKEHLFNISGDQGNDPYSNLFKTGVMSDPVEFGNLAGITFLGSEQIAGNTTFSYQVVSGTKPSLSHWNLLIMPSANDQGVQAVVVLDCNEEFGQGKDGSLKKYDRELANLHWLKFDSGFEDGEVRILSFTLEGIWQEGDVDAIAKGGKDFEETTITGPIQCACGQPFVDNRDGNIYKTVLIGEQCWMAQNLAYLPAVSPSSQGSDGNPYYYVSGYQGNSVVDAKAATGYLAYGVFYNWRAAMAGASSSTEVPSGVKGICPEGWHFPSDAEWKILEKQLGMSESDANAVGLRYSGSVGGQLKEAGTEHWLSPNTGATNTSGFTAIPVTGRSGWGHFGRPGLAAYFWTSSRNSSWGWRRTINGSSDAINRDYNVLRHGFSVRCLKN
ncbi:MAG: hypothetical protein HN936_02220 [Bacteroidetes bacterium]|jgi:uncharacterized protein (TIGR02145 family)|nr:hypothetical protein [Bacteroidota bacterium]MBT4409751.1 hypothetical protein [Bacteroidota bacterium]MBT7092032.1 hypothetical protein [Bacteroidota bacterium]MBT7462540.1 hypothetical protein [Bacteroidota bacterium]